MDFSSSEKKDNRFGCKKCGVSRSFVVEIRMKTLFTFLFFQFPGHLTFQCRNYLVNDASRKPIIAGEESSSSEEEEFISPLQRLNQIENEEKLKLKARKDLKQKLLKDSRKRNKSRSRSSSSSSDSSSSSTSSSSSRYL